VQASSLRSLFRLLGVPVAAYVVFGLATGSIYARSGVWGRTFRRDEDALGYWSAIAGWLQALGPVPAEYRALLR